MNKTNDRAMKVGMGKGEATREAILDQATRLASQVGLQGLTIGSLATRTRLSKSGLSPIMRAAGRRSRSSYVA